MFGNKKIYNHLESLKKITNKSALVKSLKSYYENTDLAIEEKYTAFDSIPTCFIIRAGNNTTEEYLHLLQRYRDISQKIYYKEKLPAKHCERNMWLVKPSDLNQGRGIELCRNLREINQCIDNKPLNSVLVVQKYIERPLLYKGRKFDIRVWTLVNDKGNVYYYNKGYVRTSSNEFTIENNHNFIHLTNNCLQQFGGNYGKYEPGNTLSFQELQEYLNDHFPLHKVSIEEHIIPRIKDLILDTIFATQSEYEKNCFELLGYDFMIDEDFRTWLIEVNTNPYLGMPNDYIKEILPNMVDEMLDIILIKEERLNSFELIYSPNEVNVRRSYCKELLYPIKEFSQKTLSNRVPKYRMSSVVRSNSKINIRNSNESLDNKAQTKMSKRLLFNDKVLHKVKYKKDKCSLKVIENFITRRENKSLKYKLTAFTNTPKRTKRHTISKIFNRVNCSQQIKIGTVDTGKELVLPCIKEYKCNISLLDKIKASVVNKDGMLGKSFNKLVKEITITDNKDSVNALNLLATPEILNQLFIESKKDLYQLFEFALTNQVNEDIRGVVMRMMMIISKNNGLKSKLIQSTILHLLVDSLIENNNSRSILQILKNLLRNKNSTSYIPGISLENEKLRIQIIQHGIILALAYILTLDDAKELKTIATNILHNVVTVNDLEWTLIMLTNEPIHDNIRTDSSVMELSEYFDMWTGKSLILSEYFYDSL